MVKPGGMSVVGEGTEAGQSREEGSLEWELLNARSKISSLLDPSFPTSAILHPLYSSEIQHDCPSRSSFDYHLAKVKSSIRRFIDEATTISLLPQQLDAESGKEGTDSKGKKQRVISLLRENSAHSAAIANANHQLKKVERQQNNGSSDLLVLLKKSKGQRCINVEEAKLSLQRFVQVCELLAKDLKMEAFAEEHSGDIENNTDHTHTLTLAASILVVDVEIGLEQKDKELWKPLIRLRLSYATDSGAVKPIVRDHTLAECLQVDLQAVADMLLGYSLEDKVDKVSNAIVHYSRARKNLETLKGLDDLSVGLSSSSIEPSVPDLFAALDGVGQKLQSSLSPSLSSSETNSASLQEQIKSNTGLAFHHIGVPYTTLVYYAESSTSLNTLDEIRNKLDRQSLLSGSTLQGKLYTLSITIAKCSIRMKAIASQSLTLPRSDNEQEPGSRLHYMAILSPPILMPKQIAYKVGLVAGLDVEQQPIVIRSKARIDQQFHPMNPSEQQTNVPSFENVLSSMGKSTHNSSRDSVHFAPEIGFGKQTAKQGIMVSQFPFDSLENLSKVVNLLREQVQINQLLSSVSFTNDATDTLDEISLKDVLNGVSNSHSLGSVRLCLAVEEGEHTCIIINVPVGIGIWILEVRLYIKNGGWTFTCVASEVGQESGKIHLDDRDQVYKDCITILDRDTGTGLDQVLRVLRNWANGSAEIKNQKSKSVDLQGDIVSPTPLHHDGKDQTGPLPKVGSKRRASQAGMEDEDELRKANRRKN